MMLAIVLLCTGFVSCSNDDDDEATGKELIEKLQGSWKFQKGTEKVMGMTITMDRSSLSEMKSSLEDLMGERVEFWDETLSFNGYTVNGEKFKLDGNQIVFDGMDPMDGFSIFVKTINSSKMILQESINMEGVNIDADMEYSKQ